MTETISNNKISHLISTSVPFFVRNDHPNFVSFLEAYYRYLEQEDETLNQIKLLRNNIDIDQSLELFLQKFYDNYLHLIPNEVLADKTLLVKHIKDFYRSKGTEKSIRFLMKILYNQDVSEIYYPKRDVIRASDGKWFVEKALKITDVMYGGSTNTDPATIQLFASKTIKGNTSNATAVVERVDSYYDGGTLVNEIKLSNEYKQFVSGETIFTSFVDGNGITRTLTANLFAGSINTVKLDVPGTGYEVGDQVIVESNTGTGAIILVSVVSSGNIRSFFPIYGGAGYQVNNSLIVSGGAGTGANGKVQTVQDDNTYHPNSYNIMLSTIELEANTPINNTVYSNLNSSNANTSICNAVSYFTYANTGPIQSLLVVNAGENYISVPTITPTANTLVRSAGILGRMEIYDGGEDYEIGDEILFYNVPGGYGYGAKANVTNVDINGAITEVKFYANSIYDIIGGTGYSQNYLPTVQIDSANGTGANVMVTAILGYGASVGSVSDLLGAIESLALINRGSGYNTPPTLNLAHIGDGTAKANATVISGVSVYPGRYINDDGHISSYNFIQDRDYYQDYSYVIKIGQSIENYRKPLKDLAHPAGMKVFGEYIWIDSNESGSVGIQNVIGTYSNTTIYVGSYTSTGNGNTSNVIVDITRNTANLSNTVYLEFETGGLSNSYNDLYTINILDANTFSVNVTSNAVNSTGIVYYSNLSD